MLQMSLFIGLVGHEPGHGFFHCVMPVFSALQALHWQRCCILSGNIRESFDDALQSS